MTCKTIRPDSDLGYEVVERDGFLEVSLEYPRSDNHYKLIHVELCDVRAADPIQIEYDFERDGWVIRQASTFEWDGEDEKFDMDWQEVAFIQAWGREK